ncbi:rab-interacting lysosomal protein isoform X1 [Hirundo rustica]|uniref:rab-interacting lysosomal protein isoform X1 n=1 Tax=Hirundo rustica TaxID=43150 RepID=UPI001A944A5E|nr:rab-interacting lysosomal protein isoform X1 [Hirundo rustica]
MPQGVPVEWQAGCRAEPVLLEPGMLLSFPSPWRPVLAGSVGITLSCRSQGSQTSRAPREPPGGCWRQAQGVGCCANTRICQEWSKTLSSLLSTVPTEITRNKPDFAEALRNFAVLWAWGSPWGLPLLSPPCLLSDSTARKEREVMLRLKEVVDRQRDELRAQAHEIVCKSRDTEALQEQLHRFMAMNEELRHKVAVVQAQLKSALEQKSDLEAAVLQSQREASRRSRTALESRRPEPGVEGAVSPSEEPQHQDGDRSPAHCCFSREELQQILQERNELKTNLFLVQEELAYYQRELLNEERIPSFCLDAMKSNIKKQRKKIRAKMLGTTEESASSDEEEGSWLPGHGTDCADAPPPESKIRSFFGLWYQGSSKDPPTSSCSRTWEIIDSLDTQLEPEGESKAGSSSPDRAVAPL